MDIVSNIEQTYAFTYPEDAGKLLRSIHSYGFEVFVEFTNTTQFCILQLRSELTEAIENITKYFPTEHKKDGFIPFAKEIESNRTVYIIYAFKQNAYYKIFLNTEEEKVGNHLTEFLGDLWSIHNILDTAPGRLIIAPR